MSKYTDKIILKFLKDMEATGTVSKESVLTLEGALGSNIVTSNMNIQELSSFPSKAGYAEVYQVINTIVKKDNITLDDIVDINTIVRSLRTAIYNLKTIKNILTNASSLFTEDIKTKMLDSRERYSFYDEKGNIVTDSYDILEDYTGPRSLLFNYGFISSWTNIPTSKIESMVNDSLPQDYRDRYSDKWYDRNTYSLASVLVNNEIDNIYGSSPYVYTNINGRSYIAILENVATILESLDVAISDTVYQLNRLVNGTEANSYINFSSLSVMLKRVEKFNTICNDDQTTLYTFKILTYMLSE